MISKKEKIKIWLEYFKQKSKKLIKKLKKFAKKYPLLIQFLALTFLYFYATVTLMYSIINSLGFCPEFIYKIIPFTKEILSFPILKMLATPEKTFLIYLGAVELILNGKFTPLIIKYNFVLIFILEMIQNLLISVWDLFCHRDMDWSVGDVVFSLENALNFFSSFFLIFFLIYLYCYAHAIFSKFVSFPGPFQKITESAAFWLNIKKKKEKSN